MVADIKNFKIDSMSFGLHAIATDADSGIKVFIENACPGDELKAEIYDVQKDMAFANITEITSASPLREEDPRCKLHKICGSCQWQHIKYEEQLNFKRINLLDALATYEGSDVLMFTYMLTSALVTCSLLVGIVVLAVKAPCATPLCKLV